MDSKLLPSERQGSRIHPSPKENELSATSKDRWSGIQRPYTEADVAKLRGTVRIEHSLARQGAEKFWRLLPSEPVVAGLGCMTGNQAIQCADAGLKAIYCS